MTDKQQMQAGGGGAKKGSPDGVSDTKTQGREKGESEGGAYPNPYPDKARKEGPGSFLGHGGQSEIAYEGGPNPNATAKGE